MLFDDIFKQVGEFGPYQILIYCLLGLVAIPTGWQGMAITFIGADMGSWCHVDELQNLNLTDEQQVHIAMAYDEDDGFSRCLRYDLNFSQFTEDELKNWNRSFIPNDTPTRRCEKLVFNTSVFESTLESQWELVCDQKPLVSLVQTVYMAGFLTGCLIFGQVSDLFGRRKALIIGLVMQVLCGFAGTFCPIYVLYCILRFLVGLSVAGAFTTTFVITMEIVGGKYRTPTGIFIQGWFAFGFILYPWMSFGIRNHIHLQLVASGCTVLLWGLYFVIPESPRWLVTHNRDEEAEAIIRQLAKFNKRECPQDLNLAENRTSEKKEDDDKKANVIDLWKGKRIRKLTALQWFCWFAASMGYYGLSLGVDFLQGSLFFNSSLVGLVELPAYLLIMPTMDKTGRKWPSVILFLLTAIFCLACVPLFGKPELNTLLTVFLMMGKCTVAGVFSILYVYAAEVFPTVVRNVGVGSSSMMARLSGLLQPLVALLRDVWVPLPFLIYGLTSLLSGLAFLFLPETLGKPLPETLEDVEHPEGKGDIEMKESRAEANGVVNSSMEKERF